jgi:hypothetical protein
MVFAADPVMDPATEEDPSIKGPEAPAAINKPLPKTEAAPSTSEILRVVNRIYFYSVDPNKKIDFNNLTTILSGTDEGAKNQLLANLKGGNTGDAHADYFKWVSLFVKAVAPSDEKRAVVYQFDLNPWGTKATKDQMFKTEIAGFEPPSPDEMSQDTENYNLFSNINQLSKMLVLSTGPEALFTDKELSANFGKMLLTGRAESLIPNPQNYNAFKNEVFSYYRIWIPVQGIEELRNVDGTKPNADQLPATMQREGKQYKGGADFYKKFMVAGRFKEPAAEGESMPATPQAQPQPQAQPRQPSPRFEPVTTKEANLVEIKEDVGRGATHYTGSYDIMQKLVEAQHKKMRIRKEALYAPSTTPSSTSKGINVPEDVLGDPTQTKRVTDEITKASKQIANAKKKINPNVQPGATQPTPQGTQPAYAAVCSSDKVSKVVNSFLDSRSWSEIRDAYTAKYGENHHHLSLKCVKCGNIETCKCRAPKITEEGVCDACMAAGV